MPIPSLLDQYIDETYQRLVQTDDTRTEFADGLGNPITFGTTPTGSLLTTASAAQNTITFTKGDGSQFNITVNTGSATTPGSPNTSVQFNGNGTFSGSTNFTFNSASNALTLTGSFNVSGSTTQIGNNSLLGNTLLSGSIIISGSTTTPSVQIYGNTTHNGHIRFDPVTTNIDQSLSASYIYVSGSTNDLYFTQNGSGYNNTTRLRWLEGNLYTGLLNGGIVSQINTHTYQISSGSGVIVKMNASYGDNPYPIIEYLNWGNLTNTIDALSSSFDQQFIAVSSSAGTPVIRAQGVPYVDGDYNDFIPIGVVVHQNRSTINGVQTFPGVGYGWKQRSFDFIKAFGPLKISGYSLAQSGSSTRGLVLSGGTAWVDGRNYTIDPNNPSYLTEATGITTSKIFRYYQSGSNWQSNWGYNTNGGAGFTDIDPTQYSNVGTLTAVPSNHWSIQRVFYFPNSATKALYIYYGNAQYANRTDAIAAILTETFTEAPNTAANAIFVGYMILRNNADFNTAASYEFRASGLFRGSGQGGAGGGGGTTSPGGSNTQIQYNNNGAFGGVTNLTWDGTTLHATGSFTGSFIGNLQGTASFATTASYALNGGVTQLLAGSGITLSPSNGLGQVTVTSTAGGGVYGNTATGSYGSFYDTTTQAVPAINAILSMSLNTTDISNGVLISGSTNPYNTYIKTQNAGTYDIQFSAQLEKLLPGGTDTIYIWLRKNGSDLAETNTAVELSQNGKAVAAWNWFVTSAANDYYQIMWSANTTNVQLTAASPATVGPAVPSVIVTVNRIDQFLSNTGSFTGSFTGQLIKTSSWASNAATASNIQGGLSTYIPLWDTDTKLTSSYFNQSSNTLKTVYNGTDVGLKLDFGTNEYVIGDPLGNQKILVNTSTDYIGIADQSSAGIKVEGASTRAVTIGDAWGNASTLTKIIVDATNNNVQITGSVVSISGSFNVQNGAEFLGSITMVLGNYGDDTEAAANGVPINGLYRKDNVVSIRVT